MTGLVVGADLGGTSTRVLVADAAGRPLAAAHAAGGNPTSHGAARAAVELVNALRGALDGLDPGSVRAAVVGVAGGSALDDPARARVFADSVAACGIAVAPEFVSDAEVAFCSATPLPSGTVLLAGTGATAARVRDRRVDALADGLGWLLGDHGSGYWVGREAVRAAVAAISGTGPPTRLAESVPRRLLGHPLEGPPRAQRSEIIRSIASRPPVELAALAPLVIAAESAGDAVASAVCDAAAAHLVETIGSVREPGEDAPLVLTGGLVSPPDSAVGSRVRALATARFAGPVLTPPDGVVGAAWLALRRARPHASKAELARVHARLSVGWSRPDGGIPGVTSPAAPDPEQPPTQALGK
jgi:N-acetylglucosamine kinase-like BadF-type ATPase